MKQRLLFLMACLSVFSFLQAKDTLSLYKLLAAENEIVKQYIDEVDEKKLVEHAIRGMLDKLDPHSTYLTPDEVKKTNESLLGNFDGIGVQFQMMEDTLLVIQPVSNGPSEKVGILAGDRIVAVNDSIIAGVEMTTDEIMSRLKGPKGTTVNLTIIRRGVDAPMKFAVVRDKIPVLSLDAAYMLEPSIGYVRLNQFGAETSEEFQKALNELKKKGMKDLVLDLQGNGGGYLNAAIDIANEFLNHEELIVYTEGRAYPRREYVAKKAGLFRKGRLVILIDEYSASASEIVAGAIQDWDRGVLVGRRTFGKGLVQRAILLPDYSMMRLTIAKYYTPTGRSIQKPYQSMTLNPSLRDSVSTPYSHEIYERYQNGEMIHRDSINLNDSLQFETKNLKRLVYGGG
ncbi:MAG: S41 family peptidase, partial [Bacteroidales bacterium]|nr:S41 family peptidase [Bacteroidales bacterium]